MPYQQCTTTFLIALFEQAIFNRRTTQNKQQHLLIQTLFTSQKPGQHLHYNPFKILF
ncbi:unnamed protein product [Paramecium sonneborni]|uniref:Uncharacterized protein n=1 Tax=Paramecium sonneborni TaxID=65129 RepID=A0A8S1MY81_9CILI|nr:unnamed protein product [Paramecium sonneborni]